jgi:hypothetical protein
MTRIPPTPAAIVKSSMDSLERIVRNLLLDNKNFASGHYASAFPRTQQFVADPLKSMAQTILERIDDARDLAVQMAAAPDILGISCTYAGTMHGRDVQACEAADGKWRVSIVIPSAFHDGDDFTGMYDGEEGALEAVASFVRTGDIPASMSPASQERDDVASPPAAP